MVLYKIVLGKEKCIMEELDKYWDNIHKNYTSCYDGWLDKYIDLLKKDDVIVELGCGRAYTSNYLMKQGFNNITACDFSEEVLRIVREENKNLKTMNFDMSRGLPFNDNSIDIIIADLSLHYFNNKTTQYIINEIYRVIKSGGYLIGRVNSVNDSNHMSPNMKQIENHFFYDGAIYKRFFDKEELKRYFNKFEIYRMEEEKMDRYEKPKVLLEFCMMKSE